MPNHAPLQKKPAADEKAAPPQRPRAFGGAGRGRAAPPPSSGGQPLPGAVQARMEASFGAPLGSVRVHQGPEPESVGAQAYTRGEHIHFRPGLFQPGSSDGLRLLGHELTHVVQQRGGRVPPAGAGAAAINRDARLEREAEHAGARAARGLPALLPGIPAATPAPASAAPVQRGTMMDLRGLSNREDVVGYIEENKKRFLFRAIAVAEEWNTENPGDPVEVPQTDTGSSTKRRLSGTLAEGTGAVKKKLKVETRGTDDEDATDQVTVANDDPREDEAEHEEDRGGGEEETRVPAREDARARKLKRSSEKREKKAANKAGKEKERKEKLKITNWDHIELHYKDDPAKRYHGIFDSRNRTAVTQLVTGAVRMIRAKDPAVTAEMKKNYPKAFAVQMGQQIGVMQGKPTGPSYGQPATYLHVVMSDSKTVTNAFPGDTAELKHGSKH